MSSIFNCLKRILGVGMSIVYGVFILKGVWGIENISFLKRNLGLIEGLPLIERFMKHVTWREYGKLDAINIV
jgi:hypothetical protein